MSYSKSARTGEARARRSHNLGGCKTCRRRHVKCDRGRPLCLTCCSIGIQCEGFASDIQWVSVRRRESEKNQSHASSRQHVDHISSSSSSSSIRRFLFTEKSRASMSTALRAHLTSGSIDASLAEIESKSKENSETPINVGPFGFFSLNPTDTTSEISQSSHDERNINDSSIQAIGNVESASFDLSASILDIPFVDMGDDLGWADLFDLTTSQMSPPLLSSEPTLYNPVSDSDTVMQIADMPLQTDGQQMIAWQRLCQRQQSELEAAAETTSELDSPVLDVLADAQFLLKHFQDHVIARILSIPAVRKSPWKILSVPAAVLTLSDLTFLNQDNITHARLANLYALIACAAYHLTVAADPAEYGSTRSSDHWQRVYQHAYEQKARVHLQLSLKSEVQDSKRAKYKDQLMAISALIIFATISGNQRDARCYLVDAERLLRIRGLAKRVISRKSRLLHHVYTWIRIVGESTYLLHNYSEAHLSLIDQYSIFRSQSEYSDQDSNRKGETSNVRLDDFLRITRQQSDRDQTQPSEPKDFESGLRDIHLEDPRTWNDSLYTEIYGIPETWLSLLSRTTRLANALEALSVFENSGCEMNKSIITDEIREMLARGSNRLENAICSMVSGKSMSCYNSDDGNRNSNDCVAREPHFHMLCALQSALLIFFYRRVRRLNPLILQSHVDDVIAALRDYDNVLEQQCLPGPGTAWPAFIAGCEAISPEKQNALLNWIRAAKAKCGFATFALAEEVMVEVWNRRSAAGKGSSNDLRGDSPQSWMDVLKERKLWLTLF